jgi:gamma-glutamyltranspeptidase/glutathione hydrolase
MNTSRPTIYGRRGMVTSGHYLATAAGIKMFAKGGNAIDAGVATGFALAVLLPHQNTIGGECPILVYTPDDGRVKAISGQGVAPKKATLEWFESNGIKDIPGDGLLSPTVPAMFGAYATVLMKYGRLSLRDVLEPAIELAEEGFPVYEALRDVINTHKERYIKEWPSTAEVSMPGGKVPQVGDILKQPALANTLRRLAGEGDARRSSGREAAIRHVIDFFYKGEIVDKILKFAKNNPVKDATGKSHTTLLEKEDFYGYETRIESPVYADYKNYRVFKCGPWTQGPVFLQQLKLLEGFNLKDIGGHNSADYIHTVAECAKLAFADREIYYGDPLFSNIPLDMLFSPEYNEEQRKRIDPAKAISKALWEETGTIDDKAYSGDTTHLDVADNEGYMMSATPSGGWIPSSPVIPSLGFPLGTRAQMFNLRKGHPNCVAPGKRPRTTLTPSLAFKDGKPWMVFGTPGGDMQDQWTLQFFLNVAEFGMDLQEAVTAPSFHINHFPNSFYPHTAEDCTIYVEEGISRDVLHKLQEKGHRLFLNPGCSHGEVCAVAYNFDNGLIEGAASPKRERNSYAFGW